MYTHTITPTQPATIQETHNPIHTVYLLTPSNYNTQPIALLEKLCDVYPCARKNPAVYKVHKYMLSTITVELL